MAFTSLSDVEQQVQKKWAPLLQKKLVASNPLIYLCNREYQGDLSRGYRDVQVSMLDIPTAQRKTIGTDAESFSTSLMSTQKVTVTCDQRVTAAFDLEDTIDLMSQLESRDSEIRDVLLKSLEIELNNYLYSKVSPSLSSPDHSVSGVSDFNATQLLGVRTLAATAKWAENKGWFGLVSPSYSSDLLAAQTMASSDYVSDFPTMSGKFVTKRFGFNIYEDNSDGLVGLGTSGSDVGLFFHPDFLLLCMALEPQIKISDLHSNGQHGYKISASLICGAALGNQGANKHIVVYNS